MILNHYELTPRAPLYMPHQSDPLNGDGIACAEFVRLRDEYGCTDAIETGTCFGSTTLFLADNFRRVFTSEISEDNIRIAVNRFDANGKKNITPFRASSPDALKHILKMVEGIPFAFLDAHWGSSCPLLDELQCFADAGIVPVIAIHDFQVPGSDLGFDSYNGQPFTLEWIAPKLTAIYGEDYGYHYNSEAEGARRGIIYIYPKNV